MAAPSLQDGIDQAGSPVKLLWKPRSAPWQPEVVRPEFAGWREEQKSWHEGVALLNLSHHMFDTFLEGPDATKLLSAVTANNYEKFAVGQAKQIIPVTPDGWLVTDGIVLREAEQKYTLSGIPAAQNWVKYHAETGGYDVTWSTDPSSAYRGGAAPVLFRYQLQGPLALEVIQRAFGGPIPETKFFHATPVTLEGRHFRALRHGMAGQTGYEFIGAWRDAEAVEDAFLRAGEPLGLVRVGAMAYATPNVESGWIPAPTPGIYTSPELLEYRKKLPLYGIEGQQPLHGSYYSENIEDYYLSPFELGYGRFISFAHEFIGREALLAARDSVARAKVTLVFGFADVRRAFGDDPGFVLSYARHRVEAGGVLAGMTHHSALLDPFGTVLSLAVLDDEYAKPGTPVDVVWGEHPGGSTDPGADLGFPRLRATVQPAPHNEHARTKYRQNP